MPVLDELLFQLPQVMDYQARYSSVKKQLHLHLLLTENVMHLEQKVDTLLRSVLQKGDTLQLTMDVLCEINRYAVKSLYAAKRKLIQEDGHETE